LAEGRVGRQSEGSTGDATTDESRKLATGEPGRRLEGRDGGGHSTQVGSQPTEEPEDATTAWTASCRKGREQNCPNAKLSGFNVDGTFAQYVVSYVHHVTPIPDGIESADAAPILCAGVTVYRAIKYSDTHIGDWIVLPGAGGGLGHLAIQYASQMGLRVVAIDTGAEKKELCLKLGAEKWIDFNESKNLVKDVKDACDGLGPHCALVTSATAAGYQQAIEYLREGGTLMAVGLPGEAKLEASIFFTVFKSLNIKGSYVGNRQDAQEALNIAARGKVKCHFVVKKLSDLKDVYEGLEQGTVVGRVVLDMSQ